MTVIDAAGKYERRRPVLVAPVQGPIPAMLQNVLDCSSSRQDYIAAMQRFRGEMYLADGAIRPEQLSADGRHIQSCDEQAWHMLSVDTETGEVVACARYRPVRPSVPFQDLGVAHAAAAQDPRTAESVRNAVEQARNSARARNMVFAEMGGWALDPNVRCSTEALRVTLHMYALGQILGGTIAISTVTRRHCSSAILRRVGGETLPIAGVDDGSYFDPEYGCDMELLCFDSSQPRPKFRLWVNDAIASLSQVQVFRQSSALPLLPGMLFQTEAIAARA